jgi:hypothetical protein
MRRLFLRPHTDDGVAAAARGHVDNFLLESKQQAE